MHYAETWNHPLGLLTQVKDWNKVSISFRDINTFGEMAQIQRKTTK